MTVPGVSQGLTHHTRTATRQDLLQVDVALRRFRADTGGCPETLEQLVPAYLKELPPDPFAGQPLQGRLGNDVWLLYSVGPERDDDGGVKRDPYDGDVAFRSEAMGAQEQ